MVKRVNMRHRCQISWRSVKPLPRCIIDPQNGVIPEKREELGPHLTQCRLGLSLPPYQVVSWFLQSFGHNNHGPKSGSCCAPFPGAGSPSNTVWPGPRPTFIPSGILIHPTVCPQYANVTYRQRDRQDRQRPDMTGRNVLQTVAQKHKRGNGVEVQCGLHISERNIWTQMLTTVVSE